MQQKQHLPQTKKKKAKKLAHIRYKKIKKIYSPKSGRELRTKIHDIQNKI